MPSKALMTFYNKLIERIRVIELPSGTLPGLLGASKAQIDACEVRAGVRFPEALRAWLRLCDGIWIQRGMQLLGVTDHAEGSSIDARMKEDPNDPDFDYKQVLPIAADCFGTRYALCLYPTASGFYPVIGRNFKGKEGGERFVIASSLPKFLDGFVTAAETMADFWPHISKSHAYRDDPDLAKITEWPGPWTSRYELVEPEPGTPGERIWKAMKRARDGPERTAKKKARTSVKKSPSKKTARTKKK
jgi:cell wall assembly regulator SMI1